MFEDTTIAAIATAYGESGIGVIRLSGPKSLAITERLFVPAAKKEGKDFSFKPRYMHFGFIADPKTQKPVDEALCVYMKGPHSYTGEDCVEIQCHGSMLSLQAILALCYQEGAEPADRGEFTKRAFMNGRLDLAQAEAVMDVIKAASEKGFGSAVSQLFGSLSERVRAIRSELLEVLVALTVEMDYPDEDIEETTLEKLSEGLAPIRKSLDDLLAGAREGRIIREGLNLVIVGKPNVGKSSLMNDFLKENRSIVTEIPGTTRDTIEEQASIRGIKVRLTDTAGIHESDDLVESLGIERSKEAFDKADLLLLLLDGSRPLSKEDLELLKMAQNRQTLVIINKQDLPQCFAEEEIGALDPEFRICKAALKEGEGLEAIADAIEDFVYGSGMRRTEDAVLSNLRHIRLAEQARDSLASAVNMIAMGEAMDFIEIDIRAAFDLLGEITGDTASDEIIKTVFERFCLGK